MPGPDAAPAAPRLRFLGCGDSQGVPRWWCGCEVCRDARAGGANARSRPAALLESGGERFLLDAPPELRLQLDAAGIDAVDGALVTHAHNDHILGLGDLADWARWTDAHLPLYAPAEVLPQLAERFGYLTRGAYRRRLPMHPLEAAERRFGGYAVTPVRVPHGFNGFAYGFRFDREGAAWAYLPDSLDLDRLEPWRGLQLLILGTSHRREDAPKAGRSVYDMREAAELVARLRPERCVLTHLSHGVDVREPAPSWASFAHDGMMLAVP